ncbi:DUF3854 domain-containing protein (plasmid) [Anabaena sp. FACHB-709]|uniref:DUF3854 domain-containing protein n=2 Tax=Nostocaceae TaxID=1162 RepID=A0A1Z4KUD5_ANAVA|nr:MULTISPECIES: DUF3854 domain-containing protein [Nostocaceae]BAY72609.1 hypothetical protein NIES23_54370 [Trichormus variabilis NIES-23]MBD2174195.1 DUF3854 domain-containing protein [Anabaena cylindrica FACHB-318]MBD2265983.1 DUF3854 domain-containing protein [Anabaena sp. FACHB-709]MBD2275484.1 DUF3854 domain-containing protein [Nostoc sp. PCC 7120 = FACHB-418]MBD2286309.1 DUF3854 domain-containing protein [Anabaena cylindrica FACHB-170]
MFDERHLQLTSAYAYSSKYFIRTVIYPLAKYIDKYLQQKAEDSINKKLYWETGKQTYAMSQDGNGGWKWEKYDPTANKFVSPPMDEQGHTASTFAEAVSHDLNKTASSSTVIDNNTTDSITQPIKAQTEEINSLAKSSGLKIQTDNQTFVTYLKTNGKIGFSLIDEQTNKIVADQEFITQLQIDVNKYLSECFQTLAINPETLNEDIYNSLKDCLTSFLSPQTPTIAKKDNQIENSEVNQLKKDITQDIPQSPEHIDPPHWQELVVGSAIAPGIASMNFESLHFNQARGVHEAWDLLMTSDKIPRTNTGRVSGGILKAYSYLDNTDGWWCNAGIDPRHFQNLTPGETANTKEWGCYKPDKPRPKTEKKDGLSLVVPGKFTKYEHPLGTEKSIFLLDVPDKIAQNIYSKAGVNPTDSERTSGFWYCVWKHNIPVTITEGAKKAASLLSQGHAAIGLAGINGGYYKTKKLENPIDNEIKPNVTESDAVIELLEIESDEVEVVDENQADNAQPQGHPTHFLHPELAVFATKGRDFKICFDFDTKPETKRNVDAATLRTGQLLEATGGKVSVISLPGPDKGVDDFIVERGREAFDQLLAQSLPLEQWNDKCHLELRSTIKLKDGTTKTVGDKNQTVAISQDNVALQTPINQSPQENLIAQILSEPVDLPAQQNKSPDESPKIPASELNISPCNFQIETSSPSAESSQLQHQSTQKNTHPSSLAQSKQQQSNNNAAPHSQQQQSPPSNTTNMHSSSTNSTTQNQQIPQQQETDDKRSWFPWKRKPIMETPLPEIPHWAKTQDVTLYKQNFQRRKLHHQENQAIATVAVALVKKYGVKNNESGKELTYVADAFVIQKKGEDYTISRRHDGKELMSFMADRWGGVNRVNLGQDFNTKNYPINILPIERQEFLLVADHLKGGKELPSLDDDPRKLASVLSSVSPSGTHNILENFKQSQLLQIMMGTIRNFEKDDLTLANYRILFRQGTGGKSTLQLFKAEQNGLITREAVRFEFERTPTGMTHQVKKMAINEADLEKLSLLAQKLHINYKALFGDPNTSRDIDLPIHPAIKSQLDKLTPPQPQDHPSPTSASVDSLISTKQESRGRGEAGEEIRAGGDFTNISSPASPASPASPDADQSLSDLLSKLEKTGKLTIGEQRQIYHELLIKSQLQQENNGTTDISLPPINIVLDDLIKQRQLLINDTYSAKVEVVSQQSPQQHTPQQSVATNSPELEF